MHDRKIAFLGAGNMAEAIIKGLIRSGVKPESLIATGKRKDRLDALHHAHRVKVSTDNLAAAAEAEVVVLAVKPQAMAKLIVQIAPAIDPQKLIVSIAAGVPIAALERKLGAGARVIRAMPNTPSLVGAGACAIAPGEHATQEDLELVSEIFSSVGLCTVVEENLLDAVTGLSGSGPAYVFLVIEALCDAGVKVGLPRHIALKLASQTVLGSAKLLIETNAHPGQLKDQVTSPGGTAIAGLHTLEEGGLRTTLMNAVEAATRRAKELGEQFLSKA